MYDMTTYYIYLDCVYHCYLLYPEKKGMICFDPFKIILVGFFFLILTWKCWLYIPWQGLFYDCKLVEDSVWVSSIWLTVHDMWLRVDDRQLTGDMVMVCLKLLFQPKVMFFTWFSIVRYNYLAKPKLEGLRNQKVSKKWSRYYSICKI